MQLKSKAWSTCLPLSTKLFDNVKYKIAADRLSIKGGKGDGASANSREFKGCGGNPLSLEYLNGLEPDTYLDACACHPAEACRQQFAAFEPKGISMTDFERPSR